MGRVNTSGTVPVSLYEHDDLGTLPQDTRPGEILTDYGNLGPEEETSTDAYIAQEIESDPELAKNPDNLKVTKEALAKLDAKTDKKVFAKRVGMTSLVKYSTSFSEAASGIWKKSKKFTVKDAQTMFKDGMNAIAKFQKYTSPTKGGIIGALGASLGYASIVDTYTALRRPGAGNKWEKFITASRSLDFKTAAGILNSYKLTSDRNGLTAFLFETTGLSSGTVDNVFGFVKIASRAPVSLPSWLTNRVSPSTSNRVNRTRNDPYIPDIADTNGNIGPANSEAATNVVTDAISGGSLPIVEAAAEEIDALGLTTDSDISLDNLIDDIRNNGYDGIEGDIPPNINALFIDDPDAALGFLEAGKAVVESGKRMGTYVEALSNADTVSLNFLTSTKEDLKEISGMYETLNAVLEPDEFVKLANAIPSPGKSKRGNIISAIEKLQGMSPEEQAILPAVQDFIDKKTRVQSGSASFDKAENVLGVVAAKDITEFLSVTETLRASQQLSILLDYIEQYGIFKMSVVMDFLNGEIDNTRPLTYMTQNELDTLTTDITTIGISEATAILNEMNRISFSFKSIESSDKFQEIITGVTESDKDEIMSSISQYGASNIVDLALSKEFGEFDSSTYVFPDGTTADTSILTDLSVTIDSMGIDKAIEITDHVGIHQSGIISNPSILTDDFFLLSSAKSIIDTRISVTDEVLAAVGEFKDFVENGGFDLTEIINTMELDPTVVITNYVDSGQITPKFANKVMEVYIDMMIEKGNSDAVSEAIKQYGPYKLSDASTKSILISILRNYQLEESRLKLTSMDLYNAGTKLLADLSLIRPSFLTESLEYRNNYFKYASIDALRALYTVPESTIYVLPILTMRGYKKLK